MTTAEAMLQSYVSSKQKCIAVQNFVNRLQTPKKCCLLDPCSQSQRRNMDKHEEIGISSCKEGSSTLPYQALRSQFGSCTNGPSTFEPVCSNGCPTTILRNLSRPSLLCSITSSLNLLVKTLPGRGGIVTCAGQYERCPSDQHTLALSLSRISRKYSKSEYLLRTTEWRNLKAGMFVRVCIS